MGSFKAMQKDERKMRNRANDTETTDRMTNGTPNPQAGPAAQRSGAKGRIPRNSIRGGAKLAPAWMKSCYALRTTHYAVRSTHGALAPHPALSPDNGREGSQRRSSFFQSSWNVTPGSKPGSLETITSPRLLTHAPS
jgi:hypothetical protein